MHPVFQTMILGSSAALPGSQRHTSGQLLQHHNRFFLIDCGEGTQMQLRRFKMPLMRINHVLISHLHGDHYLGLPGLIFTWHLLGRSKKLHVYAPKGLKDIISIQLEVSQMKLNYPIAFHELSSGNSLIYEDRRLSIETLEMKHRIPTFGFLFREKTLSRNIIKSRIEELKIPVNQMQAIKAGHDFYREDGLRVSNQEITLDPPPPRCYACCSDTAYTESFLDRIKNADLLYHEATFDNEMEELATQKYHSTAHQAASLALKAGVKKLLIGHFSARHKDTGLLLKEARSVFPETLAAEEGHIYQL